VELGVEIQILPWDADTDWSRFDGALIRTTWDYTPRVTQFLERIEAIGEVTELWNPPPVVRWNLDKRYLRTLEDRGVPMLPSGWIDEQDPWDAARIADWLDSRRLSRGFLKPVVGASASGTLRFARGETESAARHLRDNPSPGGFILQPYLESVERLGEISAVVFEGEFSHGVRKIPVPGDYRVQDDHGASDRFEEFAPDRRSAALDVVRIAEAELGLARPLLYARVDFLEDASGALWLTELELIEPSLFFRHRPAGAAMLAARIRDRLCP
jgi:glutathione synthase/RimK-type ligase-like ATP-grasp enzyme